ncbi:MAG TPA: response regulator transcription factor [Solirubrobacteraceae bacterium]
MRDLTLVDSVNGNGAAESPAIRVVIAHGDSLARIGLDALLAAEPGVGVAGCAADGEVAISLARNIRPDVLVVDVALPGIGGVEVTRRIVADPATSAVRVLLLGELEQDEEVLASLRAGASGFLLRDTERAELAQGVRAVAAGGAALAPSVVRRLMLELASQPDPGLPGPKQLDELTAREREVMALVATGLSNDQIAEQLVVSPATAKTHVSRALMKLRARDRAQLVVLAYESGLVAPRAAHVAAA